MWDMYDASSKKKERRRVREVGLVWVGITF